jgi:WhiB family redox-sensing transcriptional regulator
MSYDSEEWRDSAACAEVAPDLFFPEIGETSRHAQLICSGCDVRERCLEYALNAGETFGVWGGANRLELLALRQGRAS